MASKVFLCYRRDDSAGYAGRIEDRLVREFGQNLLFIDVDAIPLGVDFIKVLHEEVAKCAVLVAVIGNRWLDASDEAGNRRLDDEEDFVRVEIKAALQRDIPVIPILLDGVRVPKANQLPKDIEALATRNGLDVRHSSFHGDMDRLIQDLRKGPLKDAGTQQRAGSETIVMQELVRRRARLGDAEDAAVTSRERLIANAIGIITVIVVAGGGLLLLFALSGAKF
jgi:TIR domain